MGIRKLEHVGVMVKNMQESIEFYTKALGMDVKGLLPHNNPEVLLGFLGFPGDDNVVIELIEGYKPNLPSEGQVHHIAFTVDDVDAEHQRLTALGIHFTDASITTLSNGAQYIFFEGPNGEQLELFQPGAHVGTPD